MLDKSLQIQTDTMLFNISTLTQESYIYDHDGRRSVHKFPLRSHFGQIIPVRMISIGEVNITSRRNMIPRSHEPIVTEGNIPNTRGGGGYSHFFFIRGSGPASTVHPPPPPNISGISSTQKIFEILATLQKYPPFCTLTFRKTLKCIETVPDRNDP